MAKGKEIPFNLEPLDELFMTQEEKEDASRERVSEIPLSEIDSFPEHPFKVKDDEAMVEMAESVRDRGIVTPAIARLKEDGRYELISGHRRKRAAELVGLETLRVIVRDMTHDEAVIAMVDANLQREEVLPSEKAYSYKMKLDALKRQGHRSDLTCAPLGHKLNKKARDLVADEAGDSKSQIQRYIRLTELIPDILDLVDQKNLGVRPAVELSYLPKTEQVALYNVMESEVCTPSHAQTIQMRNLSKEGKLTPDVMTVIMQQELLDTGGVIVFSPKNRFVSHDTIMLSRFYTGRGYVSENCWL